MFYFLILDEYLVFSKILVDISWIIGYMVWWMEFKSGLNLENLRVVKCLIVFGSFCEVVCGLGVIYYYYVFILELVFIDILWES